MELLQRQSSLSELVLRARRRLLSTSA